MDDKRLEAKKTKQDGMKKKKNLEWVKAKKEKSKQRLLLLL